MRKLLLAALVSALAGGTVLAQTAPATPPPAAKAPAAKAPATKAPAAAARTPESLECSRQADAKGLHGKARKTFRSKCKRDLKKKA
jgi:hypothetical protein